MSENETKNLIKNWILDMNSSLKSEDVSYDTPILEKKLISSLQVMDLILYLEKLKKGAISLDNMKPESFQNINSIYSSFIETK